MSVPAPIETARLVLRADWPERDRAALARLCADPHVMRFFPQPWTRDDVDKAVERWRGHGAERGFTIMAVEDRASGRFAGMVGVKFTLPGKPFAVPEPEFAWRIDQPFWGRGYAGEAALAVGRDAFRRGLPALVAFTAVPNAPSRRVMEKLGLRRDPAEDFDFHDAVPAGSPLLRHVLYRIDRGRWEALHGP